MNLLASLNRYIPKDIMYVFVIAAVLIIARITLFKSIYFVYLFWNIFLAILPFVLSSILLYYENKHKLSKTIFICLSIVWLLLLPNAPYIVTDLIHMNRMRGAVALYDTFLLFSSAWLGLLIFMYSLNHIEKIIVKKYGELIAKIKVPSIILLTSLGIYIGRDLRFNSWDIFNPSLFEDVWSRVTHPVHFSEVCLFVIPCFFFLYLGYFAWKSVNNRE